MIEHSRTACLDSVRLFVYNKTNPIAKDDERAK